LARSAGSSRIRRGANDRPPASSRARTRQQRQPHRRVPGSARGRALGPHINPRPVAARFQGRVCTRACTGRPWRARSGRAARGRVVVSSDTKRSGRLAQGLRVHFGPPWGIRPPRPHTPLTWIRAPHVRPAILRWARIECLISPGPAPKS
jgi:hypothetical protein